MVGPQTLNLSILVRIQVWQPIMFGLTKRGFKKGLEANGLIHDAIVMGVADKYIEEEKLEGNDFGMQLLGRALNWAIPNLNYDFKTDLDKVENGEFKNRLMTDEDQIFKKALSIVNSDQLLEKLITYYAAYEIYLINTLFPKDGEIRYSGVKRMKKLIVQSYEKEPDIHSPVFKETYKNLFIEFNSHYGKFGKVLKKETIDSLFHYI